MYVSVHESISASGCTNKLLDPLELQLRALVSYLAVGTGNKLHSCLRAAITLSFVCLFVSFFFEPVFLCSPGSPGACPVGQTHVDLPASASQELRCAPPPPGRAAIYCQAISPVLEQAL